MLMKPCSACGVVQPLYQFSPNTRRTYGRQSQCKTCRARADWLSRRRLPRCTPSRVTYVRASNGELVRVRV